MSERSGRITEAQVRRELVRTSRRESRRRERIGAIVVIALALLLGTLAARLMFRLADIRGDGMTGALNSGDVVLCVRSDAPWLGTPVERGALALVRYADSGLQRVAARRVIALAGDVVSVDDEGRVTLNGLPLEEPYAVYRAEDEMDTGEVVPGGALENPFSDAPVVAPAEPDEDAAGIDDMEYPLTVPEGRAFVLCDDRENALDSRSSRFGLPTEADVLGTARAILWPVYRAGLLAQ